MGRKKTYDTRRLPRNVARIAYFICADYRRRSEAIRGGSLDEVTGDTLSRLNAAVDSAVESLEDDGVGCVILSDIINGYGYDKSTAHMYLCENSYYARRRKLLTRVAENLGYI